jgi:hypothetical protein
MRDLVPISHDAVDGLAKPSTRVFLKLLLPFLAEAANKLQNRPHLWILKLPQAALHKISDRRVSALACVLRVSDPNGILQETTD